MRLFTFCLPRGTQTTAAWLAAAFCSGRDAVVTQLKDMRFNYYYLFSYESINASHSLRLSYLWDIKKQAGSRAICSQVRSLRTGCRR